MTLEKKKSIISRVFAKAKACFMRCKVDYTKSKIDHQIAFLKEQYPEAVLAICVAHTEENIEIFIKELRESEKRREVESTVRFNETLREVKAKTQADKLNFN